MSLEEKSTYLRYLCHCFEGQELPDIVGSGLPSAVEWRAYPRSAAAIRWITRRHWTWLPSASEWRAKRDACLDLWLPGGGLGVAGSGWFSLLDTGSRDASPGLPSTTGWKVWRHWDCWCCQCEWKGLLLPVGMGYGVGTCI